MKVYHRDKRSDWETPHGFFADLDDEFHFTLDVCASQDNAKCARYFTTADDGLAQPWEGVCWMNPPYGRGVDRWIRKAYESSLQGATVVCLVKSTTIRSGGTRTRHTRRCATSRDVSSFTAPGIEPLFPSAW